jgi:hypothetical protein
MNITSSKSTYLLFVIIVCNTIFAACDKSTLPADLSGTYSGKARVIVRYDRGGHYIYMDDYVQISLIINSSGNVIGLAGGAAFEGCNVVRNRGWVERQLGIKTDFLIKGLLKGNTFDKDTVVNKNISIPFNIKNGELQGSLIQLTNGESYPIISKLKLQKN